MQPMYTARVGPACAKFQDSIWVAGGMTKLKQEPLSKEVECYDPTKNMQVFFFYFYFKYQFILFIYYLSSEELRTKKKTFLIKFFN